MFGRDTKEKRNLEVAIGLLVGYLLVGLASMIFFDKEWEAAFSNHKIIIGLAGIALTIFIIDRQRKKKEK